MIKKEIIELWPEIEWIKDEELREKTAKTWEIALERSVLTAEDLNTIPFTLLVPDLKVTFMAHKRAVVHIAKDAGIKCNEFHSGVAFLGSGCISLHYGHSPSVGALAAA